MLTKNTITVKQFDGSGFGNWDFRMKLLLEHHDVLSVLSEDPPTSSAELVSWRKNDLRARNLIVQCLGDNILEMIKNKSTAKEIMNTLSQTYKKSGVASQVQLQRKLRNMKFTSKESLNSYIVEFEKTVAELKNAGGKIDDLEVVSQLLASISEPQYQSIVTAIDILFSQDSNSVTLDFVKRKLLAEEQRQKSGDKSENSSSAAFYSGHKNVKKKFPFKCYGCGQRGHKKSDCRNKNKESRKQANVTEQEDEVAFITCLTNEKVECNGSMIKFVVDSGCTNHLVTEQYEKFLTCKQKVNHSIKVAKEGQCVKAYAEGVLQLESVNGLKVRLDNVLVCKNLTHNLLSVKKMEFKGLKIIFQDGRIYVNKSNDSVLLSGSLECGLYILNLMIPTSRSNLTQIEEKDLWHRRMGHSMHYPPSTVCEVCLQGKQTRKSFKNLPDDRKTKNLLECISSDVCGPINPDSHSGKKYFITFIDHYSHFGVIYFMENKNEAFEKFKMYLALVETKFKSVPQRLRCDNGGEYVSHQLKNLCKQKGIKIEYTIPRTPEQNGVAERYNRTLLDKARCLIFDAKMEKVFWEEAVATSAFLANRTPSSTLPENKTPAELWYKQKPNLNKIKIFGCTSYVHIPAEDRKGKLDSRSQKMFLVGYTDNGYRLWNSKDQNIISARNVVFDETKMMNQENKKVEKEVSYQNEDMESVSNGSSNPVSEEFYLDNGSNENEENIVENDNEERPRRQTRLPEKFKDYNMDDGLMAALLTGNLESDVPQTYSEAVSIGNGWETAIQSELDALNKSGTWKIIKRPAGVKTIDSRWVFRQKENNGEVLKKARLVARGYQQSEYDSIEVYSPVARLLSVRVLLSLCIESDLFVSQLDVKCAFLNGDLPEPVFMEIPDGVKVNCKPKSEYICKLVKSLYGLREAPKCWYEKLHFHLLDLGFKRSQSDPCLYFNKNIYLLLHVDDIMLFSKCNQKLRIFKQKLMSQFDMHDLSPKCQENFSLTFLGLVIEKSKNQLFLSQKELIRKILNKFNMKECKISNIPIQPRLNLKINDVSNLQNSNLPYRELIGFLMYLMLGTRPDLSYSIYFFSRFQNCYTQEHYTYLKNVLRYLKSTEDFGIKFEKSVTQESHNIISAFADADYANDQNDRKSISGFGIKIYNNFVFWKSKKQATVSLSSSEAEYISLSDCTTECLFVGQLLSEILDQNVFPVSIYEDNQSCIKMSNTLETKRSKHIDVKHHFVRQCVNDNKIKLFYVPTSDQIADIFTKPLAAPKFKNFRDKLNVCAN